MSEEVGLFFNASQTFIVLQNDKKPESRESLKAFIHT